MSDTPETGGTWNQDDMGSVLFDLWLIQQASFPLIESAISPTGLSAEEYGFYLLLSHVRDATPGDLARMTGMRANTTSATLARLERRGHIIRTPNEKDRRSVFVRLSPLGEQVLGEAIELNSQIHDRINAEIEGTHAREGVFELERVVRMLANMPPRPDGLRRE